MKTFSEAVNQLFRMRDSRAMVESWHRDHCFCIAIAEEPQIMKFIEEEYSLAVTHCMLTQEPHPMIHFLTHCIEAGIFIGRQMERLEIPVDIQKSMMPGWPKMHCEPFDHTEEYYKGGHCCTCFARER